MPRLITHEKARRIAYDWHGGQSSPMYAFASSGLVADLPALVAEIDDCKRYGLSTQLRELDQLRRFVLAMPRTSDARYPYMAPWARLNVHRNDET